MLPGGDFPPIIKGAIESVEKQGGARGIVENMGMFPTFPPARRVRLDHGTEPIPDRLAAQAASTSSSCRGNGREGPGATLGPDADQAARRCLA